MSLTDQDLDIAAGRAAYRASIDHALEGLAQAHKATTLLVSAYDVEVTEGPAARLLWAALHHAEISLLAARTLVPAPEEQAK